MGSEPPPTPGHVSALINPPHYGSNMPWPPDKLLPTPPPWTHCQQNTLTPQDKKVFVAPPRIISGTALSMSWHYGRSFSNGRPLPLLNPIAFETICPPQPRTFHVPPVSLDGVIVTVVRASRPRDISVAIYQRNEEVNSSHFVDLPAFPWCILVTY